MSVPSHALRKRQVVKYADDLDYGVQTLLKERERVGSKHRAERNANTPKMGQSEEDEKYADATQHFDAGNNNEGEQSERPDKRRCYYRTSVILIAVLTWLRCTTTTKSSSLLIEINNIHHSESIPATLQQIFTNMGESCGILLGDNNGNSNDRAVPRTTTTSQLSKQKDYCATTFGRTFGELKNLPAVEIPDACLPSVVRLSSYPTGGNGILRLLFKLNTGFLNGMTYPVDPEFLQRHSNKNMGKRHQSRKMIKTGARENKHGGGKIMKELEKNSSAYAADIVCMNNNTDVSNSINPNDYLEIPSTAGDMFIKKVHNLGTEKQRRRLLPLKCIQLIRNPGDHVIRNAIRWKSTGESNEQNTSQFVARAHTGCDIASLRKKSKAWVAHYREAHEYCARSRKVPHRAVHYEHITDLSSVPRVMEDLLLFASSAATGSLAKHRVNYAAVVREPTYAHGTLLLEACGVQLARTVHDLTGEIATEFGYQFNYDKGTWIIPLYTERSGNISLKVHRASIGDNGRKPASVADDGRRQRHRKPRFVLKWPIK